MKHTFWLLFLIPMGVGCVAQSSLEKEVDQLAQSYINEKHGEGLSVGVLLDGRTYFYGYGETAKGNGKVPDATTLFEIGSITKTFTSTLLGVAVVTGKVKLDDPVNKYLPDSIPLLQYGGRVMTLKDLANHTSGLPRMPSNFFAPVVDLQDPYRNYSVEKLFVFLRQLQLSRTPGSQYEYSNMGAGLLGIILQRIYGLSYEDLVVQNICLPLDMRDTRVVIRKEDSASFAKGYDATGNYNSPWNLSPAFAGAGALRSTARDMMKYAQGNLGGGPGILGRAIQLTHDPTFSQGNVELGLGWHYIRPGEGKVLFHNGGTGGFRTYLAIHPEKKFAVVMLANSAVPVDKEGNELMKWLEKK
ncbi:MAG: beta-lactamase family protein [Chitinophagaceae bacterium]|nr:beta-lactamase family protein [Chitinophagaceae bacterium]